MTAKLHSRNGVLIDLCSMTTNGVPQLGLKTLLGRLEHAGIPSAFVSTGTFFSQGDYITRFRETDIDIKSCRRFDLVSMLVDMVSLIHSDGEIAMVVGGPELSDQLDDACFQTIFPSPDLQKEADFICVDPRYEALPAMEAYIDKLLESNLPIYSLDRFLSHQLTGVTQNKAVLRSIVAGMPLPRLFNQGVQALERAKDEVVLLGSHDSVLAKYGSILGFDVLSSIEEALEHTDPRSSTMLLPMQNKQPTVQFAEN